LNAERNIGLVATVSARAFNRRLLPPGRDEAQRTGGLPKEIYQFWKKYMQPRGYRIKFQIVDCPGGMPGDIGISLSWGGK
jgi:hypothetical protein